uniref:(2Fe-2S)-binding protein n=1 Tax=Desulfatirhabdium butyrativorans TaxID=340467 RepID=A0A7C4VRF8_9BACT
MSITLDGVSLSVQPGQTLAQVLLASGRMDCRTEKEGDVRGIFCGMGICGECRMIVDGVPNVRICQTIVRDGMVVRRQNDAIVRREP